MRRWPFFISYCLIWTLLIPHNISISKYTHVVMLDHRPSFSILWKTNSWHSRPGINKTIDGTWLKYSFVSICQASLHTSIYMVLINIQHQSLVILCWKLCKSFHWSVSDWLIYLINSFCILSRLKWLACYLFNKRPTPFAHFPLKNREMGFGKMGINGDVLPLNWSTENSLYRISIYIFIRLSKLLKAWVY